MKNLHRFYSRHFWALVLIAIGFTAISCEQDPIESTFLASDNEEAQPVDLVEPLVDAANSRWFFFNSATRPFGMVNLSPDMVINGAWNSGYRYTEDTIRAFSHIHAWQLSGIPVLPTLGEFQGHLGADYYGSTYSHETEIVRPGYHQITLDDYGIKAELTSTTRVGFHRYTYPQAINSYVHIDFSTFLGPCDTEEGYGKQVSDTQIEGYALMAPTRRRPKSTYVYYVMQFEQPFRSFGGWKNGQIIDEAVTEVKGPKTGVYVTFPTANGEEILMKVGISYVSIDQARLNLETEIPHWDFDLVVQESREEWNNWLSKIKVTGNTLENRRRFYTDLWHALQGRRIISDVNGKYCDMTGDEPRVGQIPTDAEGNPQFNHYNSDSFWGAQWTLNTLWHLVYPKVSEEFVNSMLLMYQDGGLIPRGPSGGNYTYVMTGASSTPFIVSAYMKGIRGFDAELAWKGLEKNHSLDGIMAKAGYEHQTNQGGGLQYYIGRGYIPHPLPIDRLGYHQDGSGQTLEYAYQDWTLAQFAKVLGKEGAHYEFMNRAGHYRNIWNAEQGWMWVRNLDGSWNDSLDILNYGDGWVEGNAAQFTWWVPHDVKGLADLMGGRKNFVNRLNESFEKAVSHGFVSAKSHDAGETRQFRRRFINYGNQPSMHTAYLFNYVGAPHLTQYWSRQVIDSVYTGISPFFGYSGDEDQGLMGALAVMMKVGLFSMHGGTNEAPIYEIGSPLFDQIVIDLDERYYKGESFTITTQREGADDLYVQSALLDDQPLERVWFYHRDLVDGGNLILKMGSKPSDWGTDPREAPPSMTK